MRVLVVGEGVVMLIRYWRVFERFCRLDEGFILKLDSFLLVYKKLGVKMFLVFVGILFFLGFLLCLVFCE